MMAVTPMLRVEHTDTYSIYWEQDPALTWLVQPFLVSVYFFQNEQAYVANFIPDRERTHAPVPQRVKMFERDYYACTPSGIYTSIPAFLGISTAIADLIERRQFETHFAPGPPPISRWSKLRLNEIPLSQAAEDYRAKLAELYSNGSVLLTQYEAADRNEFETCCRTQQPGHRSVFQTELFRNPLLVSLPVFEGADYTALTLSTWTPVSPWILCGTLCGAVYSGGAYHGLAPDYQRAIALGEAAWAALWGHNYRSLYTWETNADWSKWFKGLPDWTLVSLDRDSAKITCLFATDTD